MKSLQPNTVLVAIMNKIKDWAIVNHELWYRIPVATAPEIVRNRQVQYIGFWHTANFKEEQRWRVSHFGKVKQILEVTGDDLFKKGTANHFAKRDKQYFKIEIESLEKLPQPISSIKGRRILFVPTSQEKFFKATNINGIFNESPLEDSFQDQLDKYKVPSERQYFIELSAARRYYLDFAIFCAEGKINVECDGDGYHLSPDRIHYDKTRNDELTAHGWRVLRYDTTHLLKEPDWVEKNLLQTIKECGGYPSLVDPTVHITPKWGSGQQSLF